MKIVSKKQELSDVTITHVSFVKRGANKKVFFLSKSESKNPDVEFDVRVIKDDNSPKKLLYGIVYEPDSVDSHGDCMNAVEIEKTAHEFLEYYRNIDSEHNLIAGAGTVVESYIAPSDMQIGDTVIKAGSWVLVTKATDEIWQDYLNGDVTGYSMFGIARVSIAKGDNKVETTPVQRLLEKFGVVKSFEDTLNKAIDNMKHSPYFIIDIMRDEFYKNYDWGSTTNDELIALRDSMQGAVEYLNSIIVTETMITKSEDGTALTDVQEPVIVDEPAVEPVIETKTDEPVIEETQVEKQENNQESEQEQAPVETVEKTDIATAEAIKALIEENEQLRKSNDDKQAQLDKLIVKSAFTSPVEPVNVQKETIKPKLF